MVKIALGIEYNGANYNGWQKQVDCKSTVQETLEDSLSKIANTRVSLFCAGRTDAKVHATGQVVHFNYDSNSPRKLSAWLLGGNCLLPNDISINWVKEVPEDFHARFSAIYRRYQYYFYNHKTKRALLNDRALMVGSKLNIAAMREACLYLIGEQDFSSLRSSQCESKSPFRNIISAEIKIIKDFIVLDIKANAFLHHMVRNIVGCLLEIGLNNKDSSWLKTVIAAKDRTKAGKTAPSDGLYLIEVGYKASSGLENKIYLPF